VPVRPHPFGPRARPGRMRFAQRLHAQLTHEGLPCGRGGLLSASGQRWARSLALPPPAHASVEAMFALIVVLNRSRRSTPSSASRPAPIHARRPCARSSASARYSPHTASPKVGEAARFQRARQLVRVAGLDPVVSESADSRRRGTLSKQGSPELRSALVEAAHHACQQRSPDHHLYLAGKERSNGKRAALTVARKIARRADHTLNEIEQAARP
jgi:transposase